jgi:hypothetical protein
MLKGAAALQRRITAYHEAAHAVVALKFGIRVTDIALCHSGPLAGYVRMRHGPPASKLANRISRSSELTWKLVARAIEDRAIVFLAGPVAETRLLGTMLWAHGNQSDFSRCQQLCYVLDRYRRHLTHKYGLEIPKEKPADMANRLRRRAMRILANPHTWRAVTVLAEELCGWGKLNGHDAADTVQWTRRIRNQLALRLPISGDTPPAPAKTFRAYPALAHFPADSTRAMLNGRSCQTALN